MALNELWQVKGQRIVNEMEESAIELMNKPPLKFGDIPEELQAQVRQYVDHAKGQMSQSRLSGLHLAEVKRDSALLNYTRRTNFDTMLGGVMPYAFWTTHSAFNWALWSLERPAVLSTFLRTKKLMMMGQHMPGAPSRLQGYMNVGKGILGHLPFWEPWMGDLYVNPLNIGLPIQTFMYPWERYVEQERSNDKKATRILQTQLEDEQISQSEYDQAMSTKKGSIWGEAMKQARDGEDGVLDFASLLSSPHAPLMWALNTSKGKPFQPGPFLPLTRSVKGVTAMLGIGPAGGINIEGSIRKAMGLPEFDEWDDYRTDRMIANMIAEKEIPVNEGLRAMIDQAGPIFEEAKRRAGKEYAVLAMGSLVGIPTKVYPPGEAKAREFYQRFGVAYEKYKEGDVDAMTEFFDENPEAKGRLALFDKPQERMQSFLVDQLWSKYNDLTSLHKSEVREQLGPLFDRAFLSKDTRDYAAITPETMGMWLTLLGGDPPGSLNLSEKDILPLDLAPPNIAQRAQLFYDQPERAVLPRLLETRAEILVARRG
jgi:hypothetical protein